MIDSQHIQQDWIHFFDAVHTEDGWISPLLKAVSGVSAEAAAWKPAPSVASIWEVVLHASGWMEDLLADLNGGPNVDVTDWPSIDRADDGAWQGSVRRLRDLVAQLGRQVKGLSVEELYDAPERMGKRRSERLTNIFVHNAYHAGQIVKLRQLYAAQRETAGVA